MTTTAPAETFIRTLGYEGQTENYVKTCHGKLPKVAGKNVYAIRVCNEDRTISAGSGSDLGEVILRLWGWADRFGYIVYERTGEIVAVKQRP